MVYSRSLCCLSVYKIFAERNRNCELRWRCIYPSTRLPCYHSKLLYWDLTWDLYSKMWITKKFVHFSLGIHSNRHQKPHRLDFFKLTQFTFNLVYACMYASCLKVTWVVFISLFFQLIFIIHQHSDPTTFG